MFLHIVKYKIKIVFNNKAALFWTLFFPIILATLFNLAFSNLLNGETFNSINVAVVETDTAFNDLTSIMEDTEMFVINKTTAEQAEDMLAKGKISGIIYNSKDLDMTVSNSGINQSIIKIFLDTYKEMTQTITTIASNNPQAFTDEFNSVLESEGLYTKENNVSNSTNIVVIYFYSLLAMTCLYSSFLGCSDVTKIQANQSHFAARQNVAPTHKLKIFLAYVCSSMIFQIISIIMVLAYLRFALGVAFGADTGYVFLLSFVGSFTGIMMGTCISALITKSENIKHAMLIGLTMLGCFLSGMMQVEIKYIVEKQFPLMRYLNPAALITDGYYSLYYYDTYDRFFTNLGILSLFGLVFLLITYLVLRRQKYASI